MLHRATILTLMRRCPQRPMSSLAQVSSYPLMSSDLFETAGMRWLYNDLLQRERRRIEFNAKELCDAIVQVIPGSSQCVSISRLSEGTYNRLFKLTTDNGFNVVARFPFPTAGPRQLLTQSEVATMDFIRTKFEDLPIPKVLAWSATHENPIGSEYIIMEFCEGTTLGSCHREAMQKGNLGTLARATSKMQLQLASLSFSQFGSIYYKEDVSSELQSRPLYSSGEIEDICAERFRIGPSVDRLFYRSQRAHMDLDRGPWLDVKSYLHAIVDCETTWIREYSSSPNARAQPGSREPAEAHLQAYDYVLKLASHILPSEPCLNVPTLNHPDLHPGNILVQGSQPMSITALLDWQGTCVRPPLENFTVPRIFSIRDGSLKYVAVDVENSKLKSPTPKGLAALSEDEQARASFEVQRGLGLMLYARLIRQALTEQGMPLVLYEAMFDSLPLLTLARNLLWASFRSYEDGLSNLYHVLLTWNYEFCTTNNLDGAPIPFPEEVIEDHFDKLEAERVSDKLQMAIARRLISECGIQVVAEGEVREEDYERARKELDEFRTLFLDAVESDDEKAVIEREWPFQDGKWVITAEKCV
ncbi:kinase-like domain-containing protein [Crucibulum laeve]|uniref:Altered inheritance of mitochondria protein 9, mitochondrial n=1 Tax=Crucibulum laeve TaxID=68775 RepID=A0A5C3M208_9AGAR|nr:kinase-like domain-containing protein [Crucibulum laeve]